MKNITVIGSGTMGNGIAHVFALNNYKVHLFDISTDALAKAIAVIEKNLDRQVEKGAITAEQKTSTLQNITSSDSLESAAKDADLVVEAKPEAILASNTSSISITKIAAATKRPAQVIGMHFMNPVPVMKLIEVIRGYATSDETTKTIFEISKVLGKNPVEVNDYPGFVANRILMPMINEAIISLHEGVAGVDEIDTVMKLGMAHPMGPLQLADFIGLDVCLFIMNVLYEGFGNSKYAPCPLLKNMVTAGYLGVKSGEGFYKYTKGSKDLVVSPMFGKK